MSFKPRKYQQECFDNVRRLMRYQMKDLPSLGIDGLFYDLEKCEDLEARVKKIMIVSPPRSGKGSVAMKFVADAYNAGSRVLVWVHRTLLCEDLGERLTSQMGVPASAVGYIMAGKKERRNCRIQIASVSTAIRRDISWFDADLRVTDECHRLLSAGQRELEQIHSDKFLIGFTATPYRLGKKQDFSEVFDCGIQLTTYMALEEKRFLVPCTVYEPAGAASMEGVKIRAGEYVQNEMEKKFMEDRMYGALYGEWMKYTRGKMPTAIYNVSKAHNNAVADFFRSKGVSVAVIDDTTKEGERNEILAKFNKGIFCENPIMVLCSIAVLVEGFDSPTMLCSILNYATKSRSKFLQSALRVSTPCWGPDGDWLRLPDGRYYKDKCLILDMGANVRNHCMIQAYDAFGFQMDGQPKKGEAPTKVCPECRKIVYASYPKCPHCGYEFPIEKKKDKKKFLDEVGMQEINADKHWQNLILKMPSDSVWTAHAGFLRVIALVRGYKPGWVYEALNARGEYTHDGTPEAWAKFYAWLKVKEREKGMSQVYDRMKNRVVKK